MQQNTFGSPKERQRAIVARRFQLRPRVALLTGIAIAVGAVTVAAVCCISPQRSKQWYIFRFYVLPRYLGAWARPRRPADYTGVWRDWHEDGRRNLEESLVGGVRHGKHTVFGASDRKEEEGEYREGARVGKWSWWDAGGQVVAEGLYNDGMEWEGTFKIKDPNDIFCYDVVTYKGGKRDGPYTVWNGESKLEEGAYAQDRLSGVQILWWYARRGHEPWIKAREGRFVDGKRDGLWTWWNPTGDVIAKGVYRQGMEWAGAFVEWDTDKLGVHPYRATTYSVR